MGQVTLWFCVCPHYEDEMFHFVIRRIKQVNDGLVCNCPVNAVIAGVEAVKLHCKNHGRTHAYLAMA